ncbi:hypothetical protein BIW11_09073, partial [Tropilaelaps mercedesae]
MLFEGINLQCCRLNVAEWAFSYSYYSRARRMVQRSPGYGGSARSRQSQVSIERPRNAPNSNPNQRDFRDNSDFNARINNCNGHAQNRRQSGKKLSLRNQKLNNLKQTRTHQNAEESHCHLGPLGLRLLQRELPRLNHTRRRHQYENTGSNHQQRGIQRRRETRKDSTQRQNRAKNVTARLFRNQETVNASRKSRSRAARPNRFQQNLDRQNRYQNPTHNAKDQKKYSKGSTKTKHNIRPQRVSNGGSEPR